MRHSTKLDDVAIGSRIRDFRLRRRLSQSQLAKRIGLTQQQVQKYEKGAVRISAARLMRIAGAMNVSADSLFGQPKSARPKKHSNELREATEARLLRAFAALKDGSLRNAIVRLIERIGPR